MPSPPPLDPSEFMLIQQARHPGLMSSQEPMRGIPTPEIMSPRYGSPESSHRGTIMRAHAKSFRMFGQPPVPTSTPFVSRQAPAPTATGEVRVAPINVRVCPNFLAGRCEKGSRCPFLHEIPAPPANGFTSKGSMDTMATQSTLGSYGQRILEQREGVNADDFEDEQKVFLGGLPRGLAVGRLIMEMERQGFDVLNIPSINERGFAREVVLESVAKAKALIKKGRVLVKGKKVDVRKYTPVEEEPHRGTVFFNQPGEGLAYPVEDEDGFISI